MNYGCYVPFLLATKETETKEKPPTNPLGSPELFIHKSVSFYYKPTSSNNFLESG